MVHSPSALYNIDIDGPPARLTGGASAAVALRATISSEEGGLSRQSQQAPSSIASAPTESKAVLSKIFPTSSSSSRSRARRRRTDAQANPTNDSSTPKPAVSAGEVEADDSSHVDRRKVGPSGPPSARRKPSPPDSPKVVSLITKEDVHSNGQVKADVSLTPNVSIVPASASSERRKSRRRNRNRPETKPMEPIAAEKSEESPVVTRVQIGPGRKPISYKHAMSRPVSNEAWTGSSPTVRDPHTLAQATGGGGTETVKKATTSIQESKMTSKTKSMPSISSGQVAEAKAKLLSRQLSTSVTGGERGSI